MSGPAPSPLQRTRAVLADHGLPLGLLPDTIREAAIDEGTGAFEVRLPREHRATFGGYRVSYAKTIAGRLGAGSVGSLSGVSAKKGPLWFRVSRIEADGDRLVFHVGPVAVALPRTEFEGGP